MKYNPKTGEDEPIIVTFAEVEPDYFYFQLRSEFAVWSFYSAPVWARKLSINGGDEDWLCICTKDTWEKFHQYIPWIDRMGNGDIDGFEVDGKHMVFIGSHG